MSEKIIWSEGEYSYFRNDEGKLFRRKIDTVHWKFTPWELVEETEISETDKGNQ